MLRENGVGNKYGETCILDRKKLYFSVLVQIANFETRFLFLDTLWIFEPHDRVPIFAIARIGTLWEMSLILVTLNFFQGLRSSYSVRC
jgi:hypothetical protein